MADVLADRVRIGAIRDPLCSKRVVTLIEVRLFKCLEALSFLAANALMVSH